VAPKNKAGRFRLVLEDVNGSKRTFEYDLTKAWTVQFTDVMPVDSWAVSPAAAGELDQFFDAGRSIRAMARKSSGWT